MDIRQALWLQGLAVMLLQLSLVFMALGKLISLANGYSSLMVRAAMMTPLSSTIADLPSKLKNEKSRI